MPTNERSLWVRLGLSSKQYNRGFNKAEKRQDKFKKQTTKLGTAIKGAIAGIGVAAVGSYISNVIRAQTETQRWADRLGIGVEALQELQFAGKQYGVTQDAITDGLKELSLRTDEFVKTGIGPAAEAFERLGLKQEELNKVSGDTEALFELVQSRIQNVGNVAARQRIADELFGGQGGEQFVEMLSASSEELNRMRQEARDMGAVVSSEGSKSVERLSSNLTSLGSTLSGITSNFISDFAPALNSAINALKNLANSFGTGEEAANSFMTSIRTLSAEQKKQALTSELQGLNEQIDAIEKTQSAIEQGIIGGTGEEQEKLNKLKEKRNELDKQWLKLTKDIQQGNVGGDAGGGGGGDNGGGTATPSQLTKSALGEVGSGFGLILPQIRASREGLQRLGTTIQGQVTPQMDQMIQKTNETGNVMSTNFMQGIELGQGFSNVFSGMQNVIQSSLESSKGFLESFGKFLIDFLQGLIMKFIAAAAAALLLAVAINAITGGAGLAGAAGGVGNTFKQLLGGGKGGGSIISGFLADGGTTRKSGRYMVGEKGPELLNLPAGSNVRPLSSTPSGAGEGRLVAVVTGEQLNFIQEKYNRKKGNTY